MPVPPQLRPSEKYSRAPRQATDDLSGSVNPEIRSWWQAVPDGCEGPSEDLSQMALVLSAVSRGKVPPVVETADGKAVSWGPFADWLRGKAPSEYEMRDPGWYVP